MAATLEAEWNQCLKQLQAAQQERQQYALAQDEQMSVKQVRRLEQLSEDFAQVWNSPAVQAEDQKRLLALLVEDVTLTCKGGKVKIQLRLSGGHALTLETLNLRLSAASRLYTKPEVLARLDELLNQYSDEQVAEQLNQEGYRNTRGRSFTRAGVKSLRIYRQLDSYVARQRKKLRQQGYRDAAELAQELGLSCNTIFKRARQQDGILQTKINTGKRYFCMYKLDDADQKKHHRKRENLQIQCNSH